jgi:hypothetical protein
VHHDASWDTPPTFTIKPYAKDKYVGKPKLFFCRNIMVAYEAREHGSDSKQKQSSGRINNASKGVDENIWAVQPRGACSHKATKQA